MSASSSSSGIGFAGLLTVAFIVLKLTGYIDWSWWWVLSPLWISACVTVCIIVICAVIVGTAEYRSKRRYRARILGK